MGTTRHDQQITKPSRKAITQGETEMMTLEQARSITMWMTCRHTFSHAPGYGFDNREITGAMRETCTKCGAIRWTHPTIIKTWNPKEQDAIETIRVLCPDEFRPKP
jgi:hypothetical protein